MKKIKFLRFGFFLRGIAMCIADIIPGVSGGTIALITGIYRELLNTLNLIDLNFFQTIVKFQFKKIDSKYNVNFLLSLILLHLYLKQEISFISFLSLQLQL